MNLTPAFWVLAGAIFFLFIVQAVYYFLVYRKPYSYERKRDKNKDENVKLPSVSVVIVSKNESENLAKNLPSILEQDYDNFEVIVVNMGSTDETDILLEQLSLKYSNLYHTFVPSEAENINEKKLALTIGIKAAKNDVLLFTEAYSKPVTNKWIEEFANEFGKGNEIVLGYCGLDFEKKFLMSRFVQYDNMIEQVKFLSLAIWNKAYMGLNRNLGYLKSVFFEERGFSSVLIYDDGEDDLFINRIAKNRRVGVVTSKEGMTTTTIVSNSRVWRSLKSKYLYSKKLYKGSSRFIFWLEAFSKYIFYIIVILSIIYGILYNNYLLTVFASLFFILRFIFSFIIVNKLGAMFGSGKFHVNLILFELLQPLKNFKIRRKIKKRKRNK